MRLVCVSNRLPISINIDRDTGKHIVSPSSGGLVTALRPILERAEGLWVGWAGSDVVAGDDLANALLSSRTDLGFDLVPVPIPQEEIEGFYSGFSNQIIWPLFHDFQSQSNFDPEFWNSYLRVRENFAEVVSKTLLDTDIVWVHDFHLTGLGHSLRERGIVNRCCFFLHIPFPPPDIFLKLPWRKQVIESFLAYDLVGVQTYRDLDNLADCIQLLSPYEVVRGTTSLSIQAPNREITVGAFPISINFEEFDSPPNSEAVTERAKKIRDDVGVEHLVLSVDRLDYTKGIVYRLRAFRHFLAQNPDLARQVTLMQIVVPSRELVSQYQKLKLEIEQLVTQINGEFGQPGWVPINHFFRVVTRDELLSYYLAADVCLVTPLKDGMNLVAKEYCAANHQENGVLILSEFAGAMEELGEEALTVNPYDIGGVAEALHTAIRMSVEERRLHMSHLRETIRKYDVFYWASTFLTAAKVPLSFLGQDPEPRTLVSRIRSLVNIFQSRAR